jgi:hypothetical protein
MIVRTKTGGIELDPNMLGIGCLKKIFDRDKSKNKELGTAQLLWLYYMYHPKSTFNKYKNSEKSKAIIESVFPVEHQTWNFVPEDDKHFDTAREWYINHIKKLGNPLWHSVEALKEAIYNTNQKMLNPMSSANELRTADELLKVLPVSLRRMEQQAEQEDLITDETIAGDKSIKRGEKLPDNSKR